MNTEECLQRLSDDADRAMDVVNRKTQELFALLAGDAKRFRFEFTPTHQKLIDEITRHGRISDSASFIHEKILGSNNANLVELPLKQVPRSLERLTEKIDGALKEHNKADRAFVYLAWRSKPETYYYVGKAGSRGRMNLASHGKLLEALKEATTLSFILPAMSTEENIANLEAALLYLIEFASDDLPKHNLRRETFSLHYECGSELRAIRKLIAQIHRQIE